MNLEPTVHVVDDDPAVRDSLLALIGSVGLRVQLHESARSFLEDHDPEAPGCLVLDIRMKGMSGLELQSQLRDRGITYPVIIVTGHGDVPTAVRAMREGALDFIEKPVPAQVLLDRIHQALQVDTDTRRTHDELARRKELVDALTPREQDVLGLVTQGKATKQIALELGLKPKTVDAHRGRILRKLSCESVVDLVNLVGEIRLLSQHLEGNAHAVEDPGTLTGH